MNVTPTLIATAASTLHGPIGAAIASVLLGTSVFAGVRTLFAILWSARPGIPELGTFEHARVEQLRTQNAVYRWFEPIVREFVRVPEQAIADDEADRFQLALRLSGEFEQWRPDEFNVTKRLEAVLVFVGIFLLVAPTGFTSLAAFLAITVGVLYPSLARQSVQSKANRRAKRIRLRLPFVVDQMALMMEAGAGFEECLGTIVEQNPQHPLTEEMAEVQRQISLGRPRTHALDSLRDRLRDQDISDWVFAMNQGEQLGTPLSVTLSQQAEQMRIKRAQWGEKAASEAEVQIVFPGMLVMIACLLIIVAPMLLPAVMTLFE